MEKVTKDTMLFDVLMADQSTIPLFLEVGMHCLGCPSMRYETIGNACMAHGADADELVGKINEVLENK